MTHLLRLIRLNLASLLSFFDYFLLEVSS